MTKVLVVEDEQGLREPLVYLLEKEGYEIVEAADGIQALKKFKVETPDLILLDIMLPGMSGTEVCREIRKISSVPIIMLTAKDAELDKVMGLEIGADDYVTKPYSTRELLARMKAVLRRNIETSPADGELLTAGSVAMDTNRHIVYVNGEKVAMPLKEFELLEYFLENVNLKLTRELIMDRVWGSSKFREDKTLDVHIKRLRDKIEQDPAKPKHIVTIRGVGYKFEA